MWKWWIKIHLHPVSKPQLSLFAAQLLGVFLWIYLVPNIIHTWRKTYKFSTVSTNKCSVWCRWGIHYGCLYYTTSCSNVQCNNSFSPQVFSPHRRIPPLLPLRSRSKYYLVMVYVSGFGGLEVSVLGLVPKFVGSNLAEAVGFFGRKNPQYAFLQRGSKAVGPMS